MTSASLSILLAHGVVQGALHAVACFLSILFDDLIYIDVVSGLSLSLSSLIYVIYHSKHALVGLLLCLWSLRLSFYFVARRTHLGKIRARCVPENTFSTYAFAISRCIWSLALLITMHGTPTADIAIRIELTLVALAALAFEGFADWQLLRFRREDKTHSLCTRGCWSLCRHPNMFGELLFQACLFLLVFEPSITIIPNSSALIMTASGILILPGGIQTLEERAKNAWGGTDSYRLYVQTTPLLFPYGSFIKQRTSRSAV